MTGRELAAALRPLETWAEAIQRFKRIAEESIRLESKLSGLELAQTRLTETQAKVAEAERTLTGLTTEAATLTAQLAEDRRAALAATQAEQAALVASAREAVAQHMATADGWIVKTREAAREHETRMAAWRAEETALQAHVDELREMAQRMAQRAVAAVR